MRLNKNVILPTYHFIPQFAKQTHEQLCILFHSREILNNSNALSLVPSYQGICRLLAGAEITNAV